MAMRAEATEARRRAILDAAVAAFLDRGYDGTTVEGIRDRSGASIGSIYHHFGGKEEIAGAIYVEALRDYQSGIAATLERRGSARDGIRAMVRHHVRWIVEHPGWSRFLFGMRNVPGVRAVEPAIEEMNRTILARIAAWAEPHRRAHTMLRHPTEIWYSLCLGPAQEYGRLWLVGRADTPPERAAVMLAEGAWRALRGPGTKEEP